MPPGLWVLRVLLAHKVRQDLSGQPVQQGLPLPFPGLLGRKEWLARRGRQDPPVPKGFQELLDLLDQLVPLGRQDPSRKLL